MIADRTARFVGIAVLAVAACATPSPGFAQSVADSDAPRERHSSLSWVRTDGAESCIAATQLARTIEARLGRPVFVSAADAEIAVEGRAERTATGFRAVLVITDADGVTLGDRTLESDAATCDELGELVAITVALMIDPLTAPPEPPPTPTSVPEPEPEPAPAPRHRLEFDATLVAAVGIAPSPTIGGQATFLARPPSFVPLVLEGSLMPFATVDLGAGDRARFVQVLAGIAICPLWTRLGSVELHGCVGLDAGARIVTGDAARVDETERLLIQARATMRAHWDLGRRFTLRAGLHLAVPFRRAAITADGGATTLFSPPPVAGMLDLGIGVHFP